MSKAIFLFIACLLLLLPPIFGSGEISFSDQLVFTAPFLLLLGIPHGAIDNILFLRKTSLKNYQFIGVYLLFVGVNVLLWLFLPVLAYLCFLVISAYHFGQSQFCHYFKKQPFLIKLLYFSWGSTLLSGLLYLNISELQGIMNEYDEFMQFSKLHQRDFLLYFFEGSTLSSITILIVLSLQKTLKLETMFMEFLVLLLILSSFYVLPLLIGFTFYFVILHSYKVLREEFLFLQGEQVIDTLLSFVKILAPFTLISIFGIIFLFGCIYLGALSSSYGYCLLIIISSITLPHVFVMNRFYEVVFGMRFD